MYFPAYYVQNFFDRPDQVAHWAKTMDYKRNEGHYPGRRTEDLGESKDPLVKGFFNDVIYRICTMIYMYEHFQIEASGYFQLISAEETITQKGWIHTDSAQVMLAAVIYLNDFNSGTKFYRPISPHGQLLSIVSPEGRMEAYRRGEITENYERDLEENNSNFEEIASFSGTYNSMIAFDASIPHSADFSKMKTYDGNDRLTMLIFFSRIFAPCYPIPMLKRGTQRDGQMYND